VYHFHIHLIPRYEDDGMVISSVNHADDYDEDAFKALQKTIRDAL
jgi:histidine triad (HIT) family protein